MLYMLYGVDRPGPDGRAIRARERDAHLAYLDRHRDILVLGGATLADADNSRTGSVLIVNVPDRAAADGFAAEEPFRKGGLFSAYTVTRMRRGQWNPAVAPRSAEGE